MISSGITLINNSAPQKSNGCRHLRKYHSTEEYEYVLLCMHARACA